MTPSAPVPPEPDQLLTAAVGAAREAAITTGPVGPALAGLFLVAVGGLALVYRVRTRGPG